MEIQLLNKHGLSLRQIAAEVGCAVNTVRRHLALETAPKCERKVKRKTKLGEHEAYLRERQSAARPGWIPATVLHREIVARCATISALPRDGLMCWFLKPPFLTKILHWPAK